MTIDETRSADKLQLNVHGKVDAVSSPQLQTEVLKAFQKCPNVILQMFHTSQVQD